MMKRVIVLSFLAVSTMACKTAKNEQTAIAVETVDMLKWRTLKQSDGLTLVVGAFVYFADAAVLQTHSDVYGVVINSKMHELDKKAQQFKKEPTDYVTVEVRGLVYPKPEGEEGWPYQFEIKEILNVTAASADSN